MTLLHFYLQFDLYNTCICITYFPFKVGLIRAVMTVAIETYILSTDLVNLTHRGNCHEQHC